MDKYSNTMIIIVGLAALWALVSAFMVGVHLQEWMVIYQECLAGSQGLFCAMDESFTGIIKNN
jgi:hypothetical protein